MRTFLQVTLIAAVASALAAQGTPGFYVETRVTTVSKGGSNTTTRSHITRSWTSAACSRTEGEPYLGDTTAYRVITGRPIRAFQVLPRDRKVLSISTGAGRPPTDSIMRALGSVPRFDVKPLGDGGEILGHRTHKFEYETTTISRAGERIIANAPTVTTHWMADDPADPLVAAHRATQPAIVAGAPISTRSGITLRSVTKRQWRRDVTETITREVLVWRKEVVPPSRCALPAEYKIVDLWEDLRARQALTAEMRRLSKSTNPADRARAKALGDSLFREFRNEMPPPRPLREDPSAIVIDGGAKKKP
jgi:hypothetical protein